MNLSALASKIRANGVAVEELLNETETLAADLSFVTSKFKRLKLVIVKGKKHIPVYVTEKDELQEIANSDFECYTLFDKYLGIYSKTKGVVECYMSSNLIEEALHNPEGFAAYNNKEADDYYFYKRFFAKSSDSRQSYEVGLSNSSCKAWIGPGSNAIKTFKLLPHGLESVSCIRIETGGSLTEEDAVKVLEKISGTLFFEFEYKTGKAVTLFSQEEERIRRLGPESISFPVVAALENEYDDTTVQLYLHACGTTAFPNLQYLTFYQVLEYHFGTYIKKEVHEKVKKALTDPTFNKHKEADVAKIIAIATGSGKGKSNADERTQLKATLSNIVDEVSLLEFFEEKPGMKNFFSGKNTDKGISDVKLSFEKGRDLYQDIMMRVYDIRCKVVHAKNDENFSPILPNSPEVVNMVEDLALIKFLAAKAIVASAQKMKL